jgi:hypothetical protein
MTKLTNVEVKLIDNYIIRNQVTTLDQSYFLNALCNTVPSWRAEQLVGTDTVYSNVTSPAYIAYLNTFDDKKSKML